VIVDTLFEFDAFSSAKTHAKTEADVSMLLFRADQNNRFGLVKLNNNSISSEIGERQASVGQPAIAGTFIISFGALDVAAIPNGSFSLEAGVFKSILDYGGKLFGVMSKNSPMDIGTLHDYLELKRSHCG